VLLQSAAADSGEESSDGDSVGCIHQAMLLTSAFYSMTSRQYLFREQKYHKKTTSGEEWKKIVDGALYRDE